MRLHTALLALFALLITTPAQAKWREAQSEHFVIYADQSENAIRDFAEKLEKYHAAMAYITGKGTDPVSSSNRVTIFVVRNPRAVRKLFGDTSANVAGFYQSRAGGSVAFTPKVKDGRGSELSFSEVVLLHEYAHHFMYSNYSLSFPMWYSEGFAEFYASAAFDRDGSVWLGRPAQHRAYELFRMRDVPLRLLLDTAAYTERNKDRRKSDSFYGRSWLLFHYITMQQLNPESPRKGQLAQYLQHLLDGMEPINAATQAFGDLDELDDDLDDYLGQRRAQAFKLSPDKISIGDITIRELSEGAGEVMPLLMRSRRGVDSEAAAELLPEVRAVAASYPNDPFINAALAEAEYDAGYDAEAIAAADRSLAVEPGNMDAHRQKIFAVFRIAQETEGEAAKAAWSRVTKAIQAANKLEPDNPIPLIYFYRSYAERGRASTTLAKDALVRALELAPYDKTLRMNVAKQYIEDREYDYARFTLKPLILDPHNTGSAEIAELMLAQIERLKNDAVQPESETSDTEEKSPAG